jgi:hypothetical protein
MDIIREPNVPSLLKEWIVNTRNMEFKETPCYEKFISDGKKEIDNCIL